METSKGSSCVLTGVGRCLAICDIDEGPFPSAVEINKYFDEYGGEFFREGSIDESVFRRITSIFDDVGRVSFDDLMTSMANDRSYSREALEDSLQALLTEGMICSTDDDAHFVPLSDQELYIALELDSSAVEQQQSSASDATEKLEG